MSEIYKMMFHDAKILVKNDITFFIFALAVLLGTDGWMASLVIVWPMHVALALVSKNYTGSRQLLVPMRGTYKKNVLLVLFVYSVFFMVVAVVHFFSDPSSASLPTEPAEQMSIWAKALIFFIGVVFGFMASAGIASTLTSDIASIANTDTLECQLDNYLSKHQSLFVFCVTLIAVAIGLILHVYIGGWVFLLTCLALSYLNTAYLMRYMLNRPPEEGTKINDVVPEGA